jgi:hypothetical protein
MDTEHDTPAIISRAKPAPSSLGMDTQRKSSKDFAKYDDVPSDVTKKRENTGMTNETNVKTSRSLQ